MPVVHEKTSGELNPAGGAIGGEDWDALHLGSSDWGYVFSKVSDQGVTNSTTLVNESALAVGVDADGIYRVEWEIVYTSDAAGDLKWALGVNSGVMSGWYRYIASSSSADALLVSTGLRIAATQVTANAAVGGAGATIRSLFIEAMIQPTVSTALNFQFAQNTQTAGQTATVKAGSTVRARKIA